MIGRKRDPVMEGVTVRVRKSGEQARGAIPRPLLLLLAASALFYILAHISIVVGVWPVHGSAPGSEAMLVRDGLALVAWLALPWALRRAGYAGSWAIIILPIAIFLLTRPSLFHTFTDPVYQATADVRGLANTAKAERARLSTIERAYSEERQVLVFGDEEPALPAVEELSRLAAERERGPLVVQMASYGAVFLAPAGILIGFLLGRRRPILRAFRQHRRWPFLLTVGLFLLLSLFFVERGRVLGTTPWELFLPIFIGVWAAVLADDAYNLARPGAAFKPRRILNMLVYGAVPLIPFLLIRELGLSVVLAATLAVMLLVGTRRGWWAGLMIAVWAVLVIAAFQLDYRSATRLALAYDPYHDPAEMSEVEAEQWAIRLHQFKLFDANVLAGGMLGEGSGRGHPETAPNAADDGFITLFAAQYGLAGAWAFVLLYTLFLLAMMSVAIRERGAFERSLVTGLALLIAIPFWMAVLGGIRVIPLTGVVSAFAAHGGTKLLASALSVGIIAGISHLRATAPAGTGVEIDEEGFSAEGTPGVRIR